jgi:hypothetical protein
MSACLLSPGPFTTQPITATCIFSTPGCSPSPHRHLRAQVALDLLGQLLEDGAGGAAAARAGDDHRRESAQAHRLQDLLRHDHLARAVAARLGRQRHADRVADAFLQQHRHRGGRGHDALGAHAASVRPEVQRIVAARGEVAVHAMRSCTPLTLRRGDLVARQAELLGARGALERRGTSASRITSAASGLRQPAFSSIIRASRSWSRLPQFTPMRTGLS